MYGQQYFGHIASSPDDGRREYVLPAMDNAELVAAELERRAKHPESPIRFAKGISVDKSLTEQMEWETIVGDKLVGKYLIRSNDAHSINFHFSDFHLPHGAELRCYNPSTGYALRTFTALDNVLTKELWTPIVFGEEVIIELVVDQKLEDQVRLHLMAVHHDFAGFGTTQLRQSGSCNLDVACGEGDGYPQVEAYRKQITSVGAYHFNGIEICTGVAISNTNRDCTPYFLTANHCGVNQISAPSMVIYWNFENSYCRQPYTSASGGVGDGKHNNYSIGASLRASWSQSDFTLVELNNEIDPAFEVFKAGWDRSPSLPDFGACIHHPGVEEKRISLDFDKPVIDGNLIKVLSWDIGTTEGGSSGAPLFDEKGCIIGQLFGGEASCNNDTWDAFGWFYKSWEGGGTPATSLKSWLDPNGTNETFIIEHNCSYALDYDEENTQVCNINSDEVIIPIIANEAFNNIAVLSIVDSDGLDVSLVSNTIQFELQSGIKLGQLSSTAAGQYNITVAANIHNSQIELEIPLRIEASQALTPQPTYPQHGANKLSLEQALYWNGHSNTETYAVLLAEDPLFEKIIANFNQISSPQIELETLMPNTTYYWKVKSSNICGESNWSQSQVFSTGFNFCTTIINATNVVIPNEPSVIHYEIDCPYDVNAQSVLVGNIRGRHSYVSDLYFWVTKNLQQIFLWGGGCGSTSDFSIGFSIDEQLTPACPITDGRLYKPAQTYQGILGTSALGSWDIRIEDKEAEDGGFIDQASLTICFDEVYEDLIVPSTNILFLCDENIEFEVFTSIEDAEFVDYTIVTQLGQTIPFTILGNSGPFENSNAYKIRLAKEDINNIGSSLTIRAQHQSTILSSQIRIEEGDNVPTNPILSEIDDLVVQPNDDILIELQLEPTLKTTVEIATDPDFLNTIVSEDFTETMAGYIQHLWQYGQTYYVRTINYDPFKSCTAISDVLSFDCKTSSSTTDILSECKLTVFPNPTEDQINITIAEGEDLIKQVDIYTLTGKLLDSYLPKRHSRTFATSIAHLPQGLYFLKVNLTSNRTRTVKINVQ